MEEFIKQNRKMINLELKANLNLVTNLNLD